MKNLYENKGEKNTRTVRKIQENKKQEYKEKEKFLMKRDMTVCCIWPSPAVEMRAQGLLLRGNISSKTQNQIKTPHRIKL